MVLFSPLAPYQIYENTLSRAETALVVEKGLTIGGKSITEHL